MGLTPNRAMGLTPNRHETWPNRGGVLLSLLLLVPNGSAGLLWPHPPEHTRSTRTMGGHVIMLSTSSQLRLFPECCPSRHRCQLLTHLIFFCKNCMLLRAPWTNVTAFGLQCWIKLRIPRASAWALKDICFTSHLTCSVVFLSICTSCEVADSTYTQMARDAPW